MRNQVIFFALVNLASTGVFSQPREPWNGFSEEFKKSLVVFTLDEKYKDRTAYPLPTKLENHFNRHFPSWTWASQAGSCGTAAGVSYVFDYEMNVLRGEDAVKGDSTRYPYQYCMHLWNNGQGDGFSHLDSWEVFKYTGCPTSADFGGFNWGNEFAGWMSGYQKYYNAMHNRVEDIIIIDGQQDAYVELVKQWLYDHGSGKEPGGALVVMNNDNTWQTSGGWDSTRILYTATGGGHAMTVAGWDDDVSWDYDGNGQITNPGTDVTQWEKGAWRIVNNWGDGLLWLTFRAARTNPVEPLFMGITLKENYEPLLTFKTSITHENRRQVQIKTGVAEGLDASEPDTVTGYGSAFNYCGQDFKMCGDMQGSTIEIGLDLTHLLEFVNSDEATFFLVVNCTGISGVVNNLSLMDYTGGTEKEIQCAESDVVFSEGTKTLKISRTGPSSSVKEAQSALVSNTARIRISPCPADGKTGFVSFILPSESASRVSLEIIDCCGHVLLSGHKLNTGANRKNEALWNMKAGNGKKVASGVYLARIEWTDGSGRSFKMSEKMKILD
jgi:hypothetical protein